MLHKTGSINTQGFIKQETDWTNTIQEASAKAYNDATANANNLYQAKGDYVKNTDISLDSNNKVTAISGKELIITAHQPLTNYYTKSETSGAIELSTEFGKYALKSEIPTVPTKVSDLTDSANYYKTTETSGKNEITNALNTKVDKPTSTQTGKLVYDGDTSAWVTLPAGTTIIVEGQGSVTANYDSQNSTYTVSLLASAENALTGVNDKIDTTAVAQTYQTKADMTNYLTTSDAATTYQPKGDYVSSTDITDMATQTWVGNQGFYTKASGDNDYAPKSITATVNTLTAASAGWNEVSAKLGTAQYANDSATFYTTSNPAGYLTKTVADTYYQPTGYYATSAGLTAGNQYAMTTNGWEVVQGGTSFTGVVTGTGLSGTGLSNSPLGIDTGAAINFTNGSAKSATSALSANKANSAQSAKWLRDDNATVSASDVTALQNWASSNSSTWDGVTAKSTVSANTATNVISVSANSTATTANLSATTYYTNTADSNLVAQRLFVVHNDADLVAHVTAGLCQGQGSLFFVMSGFNN